MQERNNNDILILCIKYNSFSVGHSLAFLLWHSASKTREWLNKSSFNTSKHYKEQFWSLQNKFLKNTISLQKEQSKISRGKLCSTHLRVRKKENCVLAMNTGKGVQLFEIISKCWVVIASCELNLEASVSGHVTCQSSKIKDTSIKGLHCRNVLPPYFADISARVKPWSLIITSAQMIT